MTNPILLYRDPVTFNSLVTQYRIRYNQRVPHYKALEDMCSKPFKAVQVSELLASFTADPLLYDPNSTPEPYHCAVHLPTGWVVALVPHSLMNGVYRMWQDSPPIAVDVHGTFTFRTGTASVNMACKYRYLTQEPTHANP